MISGTDKRSTKLKITIGYLALTQLGFGLVLYPFIRNSYPADDRASFDVLFWLSTGFVAWVLFGVWRFRRWARFPLLILMIVHLLLGIGETVKFDFLGVVLLTFAAADKIAFEELTKSCGLRVPKIVKWFVF